MSGRKQLGPYCQDLVGWHFPNEEYFQIIEGSNKQTFIEPINIHNTSARLRVNIYK